jgi:peptidyl-prolyl cis-trans isomerase C
MRAMLPEQYQELPAQVLFDGMLEQLVQQQVLADVAAEDMTAAAMQLGLENERRAFLAASYVEASPWPRSRMRSFRPNTTRNTASRARVEEFNASHILVETEEEAQALIDELAEGADFAELAAENSIGPSGPNGGQLGWFTAGMMVPEFEEPCSSLEPARFRPGADAVRLARDPAQRDPRTGAARLEEVRAELIEGLRRARVDARIDELDGRGGDRARRA